MKVEPIMDNQFGSMARKSTEQAQFEFAYESQASAIVEELQHPVAKAISVLAPEKRKHSKSVSCSSSDFETRTANKIYTKELVTNHTIDKSRSESHSASTFDQDRLECQIAEKVYRLITEGGNDAATTTPPSEPNKEKVVRFAGITVQEYSLQPGVNPGGMKGCPLTIGWEVISKDNLDLDVFEKRRREHRRRGDELKLVSAHREDMLRRMGYSVKEIMNGEKAANQARRARFDTIARLKSMDSQEKMEGLQRNVRNLVTFGSKKRREQKLLAPFNDEKKPTNHKSRGFRLPKLVSGKPKISSMARVYAEDESRTSYGSVDTFSS